MSEQPKAVAVLCKCGAAVFLGVRLDDDGKREVGELVADGYEAKAMPLAEARALNFGCRCCDHVTQELAGAHAQNSDAIARGWRETEKPAERQER